MDDRGPYRVFHMNRHVITFQDRERALEYVYASKHPEDWEVLDRSDS